jgi:predicted secreted protein
MVGLGVTFWVSCYMVIWWTVLFTILPFGIRSHEEEGTEAHPGADWGAPANPNIKKKFITTTWVSALVLVVVFVVVEFGLIPLPNLGAA